MRSAAERSKATAKVHAAWTPNSGDDDAMHDVSTAGFIGLRRDSSMDLDTIEREVSEQLAQLDPFAGLASMADSWWVSDGNESTGGKEEDEGTVVEGFLSHQPRYVESVVAKKLELLSRQLQAREKQVTALHRQRMQDGETIQRLQAELVNREKELEDARDEWETEREDIVRHRGMAANSGGGMMFQLKMGASAAAMAAKNRMTDSETQKQRELRLQMLKGAAEVQDLLDDPADLFASESARRFTFSRWLRVTVLRHVNPFAADVRQVEARFGSSVASYFRFFRWIIMSFVAISIPCVVFLILHVIALTQTTTASPVDWVAFVGVAPRFLLFSGYQRDEASLYVMVMMQMMILLFLFTVHKWISEDHMSKIIEAMEAGTAKPKFSKVLLNAWDFSLTSSEQVSDLKKAISEQIQVTIEEDKLAEVLRTRTRREKYKLYARRMVAFLIYLIVQAASWYVIILLTTQSTEMQEWIALKARVLAPYASSLVPATVTVINSLLPAVISFLTKLEKWDDVGFAIKAMVTRLYLAKVLNVLIQLVSYAMLLDPYLLSSTITFLDVISVNGPVIRRNVMLAFKPTAYTCRAEQIASGLLTLVVTDFTVSKVVGVTVPTLKWLVMMLIDRVKVLYNRRRQRTAPSPATVVPLREPHSTVDDEGPPPTPMTSEILISALKPPSRPTSSISTTPMQDGTYIHTTASRPPTALRPSSSLPEPTPCDSLASEGATITPVTDVMRATPTLPKTEFKVPQKMVALLYSCTIALVAIPLAPTTALLALLLHIVNFKFDKFYLIECGVSYLVRGQHFQAKPKIPWSAKDAGNFFIKFYFCTILISFMVTQFFLANRHLPKDCSLQDTALVSTEPYEIGAMCISGTYDAATELCEVDTNHPSSLYFLDTTDAKSECLEGYPKCICTMPLACGPFAYQTHGYAPVVEYVYSLQVVSAAYSYVLTNISVAWGFVGAILLVCLLLRNSLKVYAVMATAREHEVGITFASLRKKIKQLEHRLHLHKITTAQADDKHDVNRG